MTGQVRSRESTGRWRQSDAGLGDPAHARFVEINSPDFRFADLRWSRELLQHSIRDETLINTAQRIHEPPQNALRLDHDLRKLLRERPHRSCSVLWTTTSVRSTRSPLV